MSKCTQFITLGTAGGPTPKPERAPPAHAVVRNERSILVDCGEGAFGQLRKAGIDLLNVHDLFITHHHFDHIGSLFACLGLNMMMHRNTVLNIYGPPGTKAILDGLVAACDVPHEIGFGVPGQKLTHPRDFVNVVEIRPTDEIIIDEIRISCCENTHYRTEDKFGEDGPLSLSLRFDAPDRSIVFTGDTGPCVELEKFAHGCQLLVGELIDVEKIMSRIQAKNRERPEEHINMIRHHMEEHHLRPEQLGKLAARAGVEQVVAVHLPFDRLSEEEIDEYVTMIGSEFSGKVEIGEDLARY